MNGNIETIRKAVVDELLHRGLAPEIEKRIKAEIVKELQRLGINQRNFGRERGNSGVSFVEGNDYRRRIGTLNTQRSKDGVTERLRVKLNGLQDRRGRTAIDQSELKRIIQRAIEKYVK